MLRISSKHFKFDVPFKEICKYDVTAANVIVTKVISFEVKKNIAGGNSTVECMCVSKATILVFIHPLDESCPI